ncbi:hypothetical protein [Acidocella sp.]|uniref:hypothetical protein n=1 Tax=Acidocella sp. TaxID=50710 RepID=UPI00262CCAB6|nr:hypothetical protein [Acidocella sp.]
MADGPRISLGVALNILVSQRSCPGAKFSIMIPENGGFGSACAEEVIRKFAHEIISIPAPTLLVEDKLYRIENKINALRFAGNRKAILADSDTLILRTLPSSFLFRDVPSVVPEHGKHEFPWERLHENFNLNMSSVEVLLGGNEISNPWMNAGFVVCPNAEQLGNVWRTIAEEVNNLSWVPERWPYLDQISLPLAIAALSPERRFQHSSVLPEKFNQNIFYWRDDQHYVKDGFVIHHHNRVKLLEKYVPNVIIWVRELYPIIDNVIAELRAFDEN